MDWSQASGIEYFVFSFGALMLIILGGLIICVLVVLVGSFIARKIERYKRLKRTTRALWCGRCSNNDDGRGERFGLVSAFAPYRRPGCSWGVEKKEVGDG